MAPFTPEPVPTTSRLRPNIMMASRMKGMDRNRSMTFPTTRFTNRFFSTPPGLQAVMITPKISPSRKEIGAEIASICMVSTKAFQRRSGLLMTLGMMVFRKSTTLQHLHHHVFLA